MALRLAFDLGLHIDLTLHVAEGFLGQEEADLRREVFWGTYFIDQWVCHRIRYPVMPPAKIVLQYLGLLYGKAL